MFLSVVEGQKASLARPFRDLLQPTVEGYIVSDLPLVGDSYTPDEKVDAYLERSQAVVVFATADLEVGGGQFTRPNIADEIARARSKEHLRYRICVLKQHGVTLPSNTNPAYNRLDPDDPRPAFAAALGQLKAWGFAVDVPDADRTPPALESEGTGHPSPAALAPEAAAAGLEQALALIPRTRPTLGGATLVLSVAPVSGGGLLRPSELEDPVLAAWLEREALYGDHPVLERGEATTTEPTGGSLLVRQARASVSVDEAGDVVLVRPLARGADRNIALLGIIEEDVLADLEAGLSFVDRVLAHIDPNGRVSHVIPVAALTGVGYSAWRTRAEQAASPNSMTMNMSGREETIVHLSSPAQPRSSLSAQRSGLARDLMVLLRRGAKSS